MNYKQTSDLTKRAITTLYLKGWTQKEIIEVLTGVTTSICYQTIREHVIENTTLYRKELEDLYPEFNRCMIILDTNVLEMRDGSSSKILSNKRCAIFLKMADGKDNETKYKIVGLLGRGSEAIHKYTKLRDKDTVKHLLSKLD